MTEATILAPLALAAVLVVSAVAKLRDPGSAKEAFTQLRVPAALDRPWLRTLVPWFELGLAVGLLLGAFGVGVAAALGALALFAVYTVLIVRAWRAPADASCHCFGSLTTGTVTGWTVVRNVLLVAASFVAVADAALSPPLPLRLLDAGVAAWVLGAALVALAVFTIVHEPTPRPASDVAPASVSSAGPAADGVPDDADYIRLPIPYGRLGTPLGDRVTLRNLAVAKPQLLVWVSPHCGSCRPVIDAMTGWQAAMPEVDVRPVVRGGLSIDDQLPDLAYQVLVDDEQALEVFGNRGTPTAVLLGADGLLAGGPVAGPNDVTAFADEIVEHLIEGRSLGLDADADAQPVG